VANPIIRSFCNACGRETDHDIVWKDSSSVVDPNGDVVETRYSAVRCRGCAECAIREEQWYSEVPHHPGEEELTEVTYRPARLWRRVPDWLPSLQDFDPDLKGLLDEVYSATNDGQVRLLSMGVRSALDHVMIRILGGDVGSFEAKLDQMMERGHLTQKQRENLSIVIDAGSASTHRGFKPSRVLLDEMLTVMESIIRDHYVTGPMLETAKAMIPPRPARRRQSRLSDTN
jgi:hypothetical protein